jgi:hypothetical protein
MYDETVISDLKKTLKQVNDLAQLLYEQLKNDGVKVDANIF